MDDLISRQAAIDVINKALDRETLLNRFVRKVVVDAVKALPSSQPERMTNRQWIDFLSAQFDISRTSAKEMLHGMMQCKKEDNFKKLFNGGRERS